MKKFISILIFALCCLRGANAFQDSPGAHVAEFRLTQDLSTRGLPMLIEPSNSDSHDSESDYHSVSYSRFRRAYLLKNSTGHVIAESAFRNHKTAAGSPYVSLELKTLEGKTVGVLEFYREEGDAVIRNAKGEIEHFSSFSEKKGSKLVIRDSTGHELVSLERPYSSWVSEGDHWRIRVDQSQTPIDPRFFFFLADHISAVDKQSKDSAYYSYLAGQTYELTTSIFQSLFFSDTTIRGVNDQFSEYNPGRATHEDSSAGD